MADNAIGAVLVVDNGQLTGIVTDRDLALEVVGHDLNARETLVRDIMASDVATVDIDADIADVVQRMRDHGCRRVPLTEEERIAGMVSLDDLILEGDVGRDAVAEIIGEQLRAASGSLKAEGTTHPESPARPEMATGRAARALMRRRGRAELAYSKVLHAVEAHTGLNQKADAERALLVVLGAVCRRVTPAQAAHLLAQLPSKLKEDLDRVLQGPDRRITREAIETELVREMKVDYAAAAQIADGIGRAIANTVSSGEIQGFRGQLPAELKGIFPAPPSPI